MTPQWAEGIALALADRAWNEALGRTLKLTLRGSASGDGEAQIDDFHLALPSLDATYQGLIGPKTLHGKLGLQAPDLGRFADVVQLNGGQDIVGQLPGVPPEPLGQRENAVDLKVGAIRSP